MNWGTPVIFLVALAVALIAVRYIARAAKQRRRTARRKKFSRAQAEAVAKRGRSTISARSEMRDADSPTTIIDSVSHGGHRPPSRDVVKPPRRRR